MTIVRIIGNAPTAADGMDPKFKGVYLGVNSAPLLFKARGMRCDHLWIQDWRFIDEKGHMFKEAGVDLNDSHLYVCSYFRRALVPYRQVSFVRSLGRDGFSLHPDRGVFEGYSAAYGALQLALGWKPKRVELYGVDFSYSLGANRFYQTRVGWDLDLHVHEKQIIGMQKAKKLIEDKLSIEVAFMTDSLVNTLIPIDT